MSILLHVMQGALPPGTCLNLPLGQTVHSPPCDRALALVPGGHPVQLSEDEDAGGEMVPEGQLWQFELEVAPDFLISALAVRA